MDRKEILQVFDDIKKDLYLARSESVNGRFMQSKLIIWHTIYEQIDSLFEMLDEAIEKK